MISYWLEIERTSGALNQSWLNTQTEKREKVKELLLKYIKSILLFRKKERS
jgi:hypothetical protein